MSLTDANHNSKRIRQIIMSIVVSLFFFLSYLPFSNAIPLVENTSNLILTGPLKQGGLLVGQVKEGVAVQYQDQLLPITPDGRFIIGLDRDAPKEIVLTVINENNDYEYHDLNIAARDYVIQRIEGVAKQYVSPDPVQVKRSRKEAAKVRLARKQQRPQQDRLT